MSKAAPERRPILNGAKTELSKELASNENKFKEPQLGYWGGLMNLTKVFIGTPVFSLPVAVKEGGLVGSAFGMVLVFLMARRCFFLLVGSAVRLYAAFGVTKLTYSEVLDHALALNRCGAVRRWSFLAPYVIGVSTISVQIGLGTANMIFISESIMKIVDAFYPEQDIPYQLYTLALAVILLVYFALRHLRHLVPLTAFGNLLMILCVASTIGYCIYLMANGLEIGWKKTQINYFGSLNQMIFFLSTLLGPYVGVLGVLPVENQLDNKTDMTQTVGLINVTAVFSLFIYLCVGYFGYLTFGHRATIITLNLANAPGVVFVIVGCCAVGFIGIGIAMYIFGIIVRHRLALFWQRFGSVQHGDTVELLADYTSRFVFLFVCLFISMVLPFLEEVFAFIGSFAVSPLVFIFPPLFSILLMPEMSRLEEHNAEKIDWSPLLRRPSFWLNIFISTFGIACWIAGTYRMSEKRPIVTNDGAPKERSEKRKEDKFKEPQLGYLGGLMSLTKLLIGTSVLGLPVAIKAGGLVGSGLGLSVLFILIWYCLHLLVSSVHQMYTGLGVVRMTYGEAVQQCFELHRSAAVRRWSVLGPFLVGFCIICITVGLGVIEVVFISENVMKLVESNWPELDVSFRVYVLCLFVLLLIYLVIRHLKHLVPFSTVANLLSVLSLIAMVAYCIGLIVNGLNLGFKASNVRIVGSFNSIMVFVSTILLAFKGIDGLVAIENQLEDKRNMTRRLGLINVALAFCVVVFFSLGFAGYLTFGEYATIITLNLPHTSGMVAVSLGYCVVAFVGVGVHMYIFGTIVRYRFASIWQRYGRFQNEETVELFADYTSRALFLVVVFLFSVLLPFLEEIYSLVGSFAVSPLIFVFPTVLGVFLSPEMTRLNQQSDDGIDWSSILRRPTFWLNSIIFLFGVFCWLSGSIVSIINIFSKTTDGSFYKPLPKFGNYNYTM